jgi:hypothetical protein
MENEELIKMLSEINKQMVLKDIVLTNGQLIPVEGEYEFEFSYEKPIFKITTKNKKHRQIVILGANKIAGFVLNNDI